MTQLAIVLLCDLAAVAASPTVVEFDGESYFSAFTSNQPTFRLVEFVREGETVENWTKLFAIRNFPTGNDPQAAVAQFEQVVKQHNPLAGVRVLVKEDRTEAIIDFLTWPQDAKYMELNIHRYLKKSEYPGLISYQFAYRFQRTSETTADEIRTIKERWVKLMTQIDPPVQFGK